MEQAEQVYLSSLLDGGDVLAAMDLAIIAYKVLVRRSLLEVKDVDQCASFICGEILSVVHPILVACDRKGIPMILVLDENRFFSAARLPSILVRRSRGYSDALMTAHGAKVKGVSLC